MPSHYTAKDANKNDTGQPDQTTQSDMWLSCLNIVTEMTHIAIEPRPVISNNVAFWQV